MPNVRIKNDAPNSRISSFQTGRTGVGEIVPTDVLVYAGTPIGLLLSLTYATDMTLMQNVQLPYGDFRPTVRIVNNN